MILEVEEASCARGAYVNLGIPRGADGQHQQWLIVPADSSKSVGYYIKTFCGKCLDVF